MKKNILIAFIFCSLFSQAQVAVDNVACGEYLALHHCTDSTARAFIYHAGFVQFLPYNMQGHKAVSVGMLFNRGIMLDETGSVWLTAADTIATKIMQDSTGAPFDGNVAVDGYMGTLITIRKDGSIWYGLDEVNYKFYGGASKTWQRPFKLNQPNVKFTAICAGISLLGLTSTGDVYQWDKGSSNYRKVSLPGAASLITVSNTGFYIAVVNGYPYAWGFESRYWGGNGSSYTPAAPQPLKDVWQMAYPIKKIATNDNTIVYIDTNGDMYAIGDNPNGEVGNGQESVNHAEKYLTPYAWSWTKYEALTYGPAIQIGKDRKWKDVFNSKIYGFYHYAVDVNGGLYFWGRDKSWVGGAGVVNANEGKYPNMLDCLVPTLRNPLSITKTQTVQMNAVPYSLTLGPDQNIIGSVFTVSAKGVPTSVSAGTRRYGYDIVSIKFTVLSGPTQAGNTLLGNSITFTNALSGKYVIAAQMTDNNTGTISDTTVVNVTIPNLPPIASASAPDSITLPTDSAMLDASGSSDPDGSIASYSWTLVSGPSAAFLANQQASRCLARQLVPGTYVFQVTITDNQGATAKATVAILVKSRPYITKTETFYTPTGLQVVVHWSDGKVETEQ